MQLIRKFNKGLRFLLCVVGIYSKHAWVIPLKDKKKILQLLQIFTNSYKSYNITILNSFQKILKESNGRLNKILLYKGSKFDNKSTK